MVAAVARKNPAPRSRETRYIEAEDGCTYTRMRTEHRGANSEMDTLMSKSWRDTPNLGKTLSLKEFNTTKKACTEYPEHGEVTDALAHAITILLSENKTLKKELELCQELLHQKKETAGMSYSEVCRIPVSGNRSNPPGQKVEGYQSSSLTEQFRGYGASRKANRCENQEVAAQAINYSTEDADVCWHFLRRRCRFGSKCRKSHRRKECRFFTENHCRFGESCWFIHKESAKASEADETVIEQTPDKSATKNPETTRDPKQARKTNSSHEPRYSSIKVEVEAPPPTKLKNSKSEANASQEKEAKAEKVQTDVSRIVIKPSKTSYKSLEESNEESRKLENSDKVADGKYSSNEENLPENEKDFDEDIVVDIANGILPDSTKHISDLKSGKVWLELLNKISSQNYRTNQNGRKNYKSILKMLEETGKDATFLVEELDKVLSGDKKVNFKVASNFIEILKQYEICKDYNVKDWIICEVIDDLFRNLKKGKDEIDNEAKEQEKVRRFPVDSD